MSLIDQTPHNSQTAPHPSPRFMKQNGAVRIDHLLIADMVSSGARVLDIGCGDGALLKLLEEKKQIDGRGMELSQEGVNLCVASGLSVVQGDADHDLAHYPDTAFDYAILSQTIQATHRPRDVLAQLLRIANYVIISFPNFGHWRIRAQILFQGKMPMTTNLSVPWYETPNIHFCTIKDFVELCNTLDTKIERSVALNAKGNRLGHGLNKNLGLAIPLFMQNLIGEQAVFLLKRK